MAAAVSRLRRIMVTKEVDTLRTVTRHHLAIPFRSQHAPMKKPPTARRTPPAPTTPTGQVPPTLFRRSLREWQRRFKAQRAMAQGEAEPAEPEKAPGTPAS
jgi:hypothetical protein